MVRVASSAMRYDATQARLFTTQDQARLFTTQDQAKLKLLKWKLMSWSIMSKETTQCLVYHFLVCRTQKTKWNGDILRVGNTTFSPHGEDFVYVSCNLLWFWYQNFTLCKKTQPSKLLFIYFYQELWTHVILNIYFVLIFIEFCLENMHS